MSAEERMKILKMIEEGKITAEEGTRLLGALNKQKKRASTPSEGGPRWLRVRVLDLHTGKESVRVNLPIGLVNVGMRMGARFIPDAEQQTVMEDLAQALSQGMTGKIVDIVDEEEGQRVEIFVE
ncbi:MAG: hypothetical protein E4G99_13610 [Anaerolineales bacterium]|nr:MAG: hypothetical protein E4G99_13610 [Anaerolineales bacterium]